MMRSRKKVVIKQKLIKILFSLIVSFSLSSAYAADTDIPKVDDMNKQIPKVNKNLQKKGQSHPDQPSERYGEFDYRSSGLSLNVMVRNLFAASAALSIASSSGTA